MKKKISLILSKIFSIYINFRYLPFRTAKKLPMLFYWKTKVKIINGSSIKFTDTPNRFTFRFGVDESFSLPSNDKNIFYLNKSNIELSSEGLIEIRKGSIISLNHANVYVGKNFYANNNFFLESFKEILIGDNSMFGYEVSIRDSDGHIFNGMRESSSSEINIGKEVWIGAKSTILKGSTIKNGVVVGYGSLTTKRSNHHEEKDCIAGHPAKVIKSNVTWSREQP